MVVSTYNNHISNIISVEDEKTGQVVMIVQASDENKDEGLKDLTIAFQASHDIEELVTSFETDMKIIRITPKKLERFG